MNVKYLNSKCNKFILRAITLRKKDSVIDNIISDVIYSEVFDEDEHIQENIEKYGLTYPYIALLTYQNGSDYMLSLLEKTGFSEPVVEKLRSAIEVSDKEIKELKEFAKELYKIANEVNC